MGVSLNAHPQTRTNLRMFENSTADSIWN